MQAPAIKLASGPCLSKMELSKNELNQITCMFTATLCNQKIAFTMPSRFYSRKMEMDKIQASTIIREGYEALDKIDQMVEIMKGILPEVDNFKAKTHEAWIVCKENPTVKNQTEHRFNLRKPTKINALFKENLAFLNSLLAKLKNENLDHAAYKFCDLPENIFINIKNLHIKYSTRVGQTDLMGTLETIASKINTIVTNLQNESKTVGKEINPLRELGCTIDLEVFGKVEEDYERAYFITCIPENIDLTKLRAVLEVGYPNHPLIEPILRTLIQRAAAKKGRTYQELYKMDQLAGFPWTSGENNPLFLDVVNRRYYIRKKFIGIASSSYDYQKAVFMQIKEDYSMKFKTNYPEFYPNKNPLKWPNVDQGFKEIRRAFSFANESPALFKRAEKIISVLYKLAECRFIPNACLKTKNSVTEMVCYYLSKIDVSLDTIPVPPPKEGKTPRATLGDAIAAWHFKGLLTSEERVQQYGYAILSLCLSEHRPDWSPDEFTRMILTGFDDTIQNDHYQKELPKPNPEELAALMEHILKTKIVLECRSAV